MDGIEKLKRCPCCGSLAKLESLQYYQSYYIKCKGCGLTTPTSSVIAEVISIWNRRAE